MKFLALLRGINVGGNNIIKKDELKRCFERAGCASVLTYIQSGNLLFRAGGKNKATLEKAIQKELHKALGKDIPLVLFTEAEYKNIVAAAPKEWGHQADHKHNALFVIDGSSSKALAALLPEHDPKVEQVHLGPQVIFWSAAKKDYAKTSYAKELVKSPAYKKVSIRNSNTTFKLKELFEKI